MGGGREGVVWRDDYVRKTDKCSFVWRKFNVDNVAIILV
jgi:hypothetical protein